MTAAELAAYMEATDKTAQPWLLAQLRLAKLQENRHKLAPDVYTQALADIHADLMRLGEWWHEQEDEVF